MLRTFFGVGLTTLATLLLELLLTRIFSVTLYYHFAFMVISLALFGLGLSGVMLYIRPERYPAEQLPALLSRHARRFALSTVVTLAFVVNHALGSQMDVLKPGFFSWQHFFQLAFLYGFATVPFYYGGMVVSLALATLHRKVATLYFFDLVGASLACLLLDPLLRLLGGPDAVLAVAVLGAGAALVFGGGARDAPWKLERSSVAVLVLLCGVLVLNLTAGVIRVGSFKEVKAELLEFSRWNAMSRVEVQQLPGFGPSLTIDANARTVIFSTTHKNPFSEEHGISSLAHQLKQGGHALIIGPGGGIDVHAALKNGVERITLAEINPIILHDVMLDRYRDYSGKMYARPDVSPNLAEGRSFIRRSKTQYDVIQATLVDTWAATAAGSFALSENHLYTVEAFEDYLAHLSKDGVVSMSRWLNVPGMEFFRLFSLCRAALARRGVKHPAPYVFAAGRDKVGTLLLKRTPFTDPELNRLHKLCDERGFVVVHSPRGGQRNPAAFILGKKDPAAFYASFPVDLRPVVDDRPFFFYAVKPEQLFGAVFSNKLLDLNSFSSVILVALLGLVTILVLAGIVLPLWLGQRTALTRHTGSKLRDLGYFLAIGVGFIMVEIVLLQQLSLYLGHPVHALRVVLFALLLTGGLGSLASSRVRTPAGLVRLQTVAGLGVVVLAGIYSVGLGPLLHGTIGASLTVRAVTSAGLVALPGLLMGVMLPGGIRLIATRHRKVIPWAWGINGAASVLGSVLAMVLAIHLGFTTTLLCGAALYLAAVLAGLRRPGDNTAD